MPGTIHDPIGGQSRATIAAKQAKPMEEFAERTKREAEERKKQRTAEGGRGGGYNDRQEVEHRQPPREDDCAYDDFGRKKNDKSQLSKADRAAAALKRLQAKPSETGPSRKESRSRSRSPAPESRRARDPKPPHAGFRPRGANHRF
mmetsp:Transcript_54806/g.113249  ORF Transcript_54806/g.113249 Transcript_54806/m.113249 type:complete len:146 (+) Transcript_54806:20-457(+)